MSTESAVDVCISCFSVPVLKSRDQGQLKEGLCWALLPESEVVLVGGAEAEEQEPESSHPYPKV